MKTNTPLKRNTSLRSYSSLKSNKGLKRSSFKRNKELTPQQELDSIVSKVVRLGSADSDGMVCCITCGVYYFWEVMQCGHFQKRGHLATRYELKNLGAQCEDCNCFHDGRQEKHAEYIDKVYGPGTADQLRVQSKTIVYDFNYKEEIVKWSVLLQKLVDSSNKQINY